MKKNNRNQSLLFVKTELPYYICTSKNDVNIFFSTKEIKSD